MLKWKVIVILLICVNQVFSQKKTINSTVYGEWQSISAEHISSHGNIVTYQISPLAGDGELFLRHSLSGNTKSIPRGKQVKIQHDEKFVGFEIAPQYDTIRKLKIDKVPKKKWPLDSAGIYVFEKDTVLLFPKVTSIMVAESGGDWTGILHDKKYTISKEKKQESKKKCRFFKKDIPKPNIAKENGSILRMLQPLTGKELLIESVKHYATSEYGNTWSWTQSKTYNDSIDSSFVSIFHSRTGTIDVIWKGEGEASQLNFDKTGNQMAFLWTTDTSDVKVHSLCLWNLQSNMTEIVVDTIAPFLAKNQSVSRHIKPYFSDNSKRLFFGISDKPVLPEKDTVPEDEKARLDIWSWTDGRTQPQQLNELKEDLKHADLFMYKISEKSFLQLTDSLVDKIKITQKNNGRYALAYTQKPYFKEMTWDTWYFDYFKVDLNTGKRNKLLSHHNGRVSLSPSGNYFTYYQPIDSSWYMQDLEKGITINLTKNTKGRFYEKFHDVPGLPGAAGGVTWFEDEKNILLNDQYDFWIFNLDGKEPQRITKGVEKEVQFDYVKLQKEEEYVEINRPLYFQFFNEKTKDEGVAKYENDKLEILFNEALRITKLEKADSSDVVILRQMSLLEYPEIQLTDLSFQKREKLTTTNPHQKDYNWATVELFSWEAYNGDSLSGLLYKPEDFDSTKNYPLVVYFYERYTRGFHYYYAPKPTASIVYPTEYASNGYMVFIPDISYEVGHPAKSAYNAIVSGTDALLKKYPYIDSNRMALQGQSWGGYQTAQLITMTNKYKCAMAGAPVSNMFSAYGGVRWGSGHNRAFQYEKGQSRIGKTIWEAPELYIENSPIFHLPNVETPLLIMHNDGDGAVPWYQGIEMFFGMRRLDKPVWMLNYNGDEHNLMKSANRMDLSIRMREFFDHYLLDKPMPKWMAEGFPAIDNEKNMQH